MESKSSSGGASSSSRNVYKAPSIPHNSMYFKFDVTLILLISMVRTWKSFPLIFVHRATEKKEIPAR